LKEGREGWRDTGRTKDKRKAGEERKDGRTEGRKGGRNTGRK
jgi:hypothetical protein